MDGILRSVQSLAWEQEASRDKHGRPCFPAERSDEFHSPQVSQAMMDTFRDLEYPGGKGFALVLTHDIDLLGPSVPRRLINSCKWLGKGQLSRSFAELRSGAGRHPYSDLVSMVQKEQKLEGNSTFFIMNAAKDHTGAGYPLADIADQLSRINGMGAEIGLHGSYEACRSQEMIAREKEGIEKAVGVRIIGYRNHYLRFLVPETFGHLSQCGIRYDSTLGFADNYGFRNGMVHPYRLDTEQERSSVLELPLAVMDASLYSYMGLAPSEAKAVCEGLLGTAKRLHGTLVVLWHNSTFYDPRYLEWGALYWHLLARAKEENGWLCSGAELCSWWEANGR